MRIVFDQGTPVPLRRALTDHTVATAFELGWSELDNGALLDSAEGQFDVLITTDRNLRHQQDLVSRKLAILVLPTTSWPTIERHLGEILTALESLSPGGCHEVSFSV